MAGFYGHRTVLADLRKHLRTGKVIAATLKVRGANDATTSIAFAYAYKWPQTERTGVGGPGYPTNLGRVTLWRWGETSRPRPDDKLTLSGDSTEYQILAVTPRLNADESNNCAVYDCDVAS